MAVSIPFYTVEELANFPDDGNRYELIDGVLLVTESPDQAHQVIAARLIHLLSTALGTDVRVVGPGVVPRAPRTQLEPDVLVYPARYPANCPWSQITEHRLAVEVFSPGSRIYDREFKRNAYLRLGVTEVWLVDLDELTIEVCSSEGLVTLCRDRVMLLHPESKRPVQIELAELFAALV